MCEKNADIFFFFFLSLAANLMENMPLCLADKSDSNVSVSPANQDTEVHKIKADKFASRLYKKIK